MDRLKNDRRAADLMQKIHNRREAGQVEFVDHATDDNGKLLPLAVTLPAKQGHGPRHHRKRTFAAADQVMPPRHIMIAQCSVTLQCVVGSALEILTNSNSLSPVARPRSSH